MTMTIELTEQQRKQLNAPQPIAIDPATNEEYVLVRRKVFERMQVLPPVGKWKDYTDLTLTVIHAVFIRTTTTSSQPLVPRGLRR